MHPPPADPMFQTTPTTATRSNITITRIETPIITENVQSQLFESTIEQATEQLTEQIPEPLHVQIPEQPTEQGPEQSIPQPRDALIFRADTGAGTSRSFRTRAQSTSSNEALRNGQPKRL